MRFKPTNIILAVLLVFIVLLLLDRCKKQENYDNLLSQVSKYKLQEQAFEQKRLKDSSTIITQSQTILTQKEAYELGLLELKGDIKRVQSQVRQMQNVVIKDVNVPFIPNGFADTTGWYAQYKSGDTTKSVIDSLLSNSILVPQDIYLDTKWIKMQGVVKKSGISINTMSLPNENKVTIGYRRAGFLKLKNEPVVEIYNSNPYLQVNSVSNVVIKEKKGLLQKWWFWGGVGALSGFLISK